MTTREKRITVTIKRDAAASGIPLPSYATAGSAGMDLRASEAAELKPGERKAVGTGLHMQIPEGCEGQLRPRSGLALKNGVTLLNTPGTIDSDYRGEVRVILINLGDEVFRVAPGDRIAQIVFAPTCHAELKTCEDLSETERATGGFGSTGVA